MNHEEIHSQEIQSRMESNAWDQMIASNVSEKYIRIQKRNRLLITASVLLLTGLISTFSVLTPTDFSDSNLVELESYRLFFSDDMNLSDDAIYQEESISSLIEPISFFIE